MARINVVLKEPGKPARTQIIDNTLEELQRLVGGYLEAVPSADPHVALYVDEEGLIKGLEPNVFGLFGNVLATGFDPDSGETVDLTVRQAARLVAMFGR